MSGKLFFVPVRPLVNLNGFLAADAVLSFYETGTLNPATVYSDAGLTVALPNEITANAVGVFPDIYLDDAETYRVKIEIPSTGEDIDVDPYYPWDAPYSESELVPSGTLSGLTGADLVGYSSSSASSVIRTARNKMDDILHAKDFGAVGDGVADDTLPLKRLLAAMQLTGKAGCLGAVNNNTRYKITPGQLEWTFSNNPTVTSPGPAGPKLFTDGKVTLVSDGTVDAPLLSVHNDPNYGFRFIQGGFIGDLEFEDTSSGGTAVNRHGLLIYGINSMSFGVMRSANGLRGDTIRYNGRGNTSTADGWHVVGCDFDGAYQFNGSGYAFNCNAIAQEFNFNRVNLIWASKNIGAWKGVNVGGYIASIAAQYCSGIAVDVVSNTGTVQQMKIGAMELDANYQNLRISGIQHLDIDFVRHIYRNDAETGSVVWPTKAIEFADVNGGQVVTNINIVSHYRFDNGIVDANLPGAIVEYGNNSNFYSIDIQNFHSAGFTPNPARFLSNIAPLGRYLTSRMNGSYILKQKAVSGHVIVRVATGDAATQTKLTYNNSEPVTYANELTDQDGLFSGTTFTAPATGLYFFRARHLVQPNANDVVRLGFFLNAATTPFQETYHKMPDGYTSTESVPIELVSLATLTRGDTIQVCLNEPQQRPLLAGSLTVPENNYFEAVLL